MGNLIHAPLDLLFYGGMILLTAFIFWNRGRGNAYKEVAKASGVNANVLMDEVAIILEKNK